MSRKSVGKILFASVLFGGAALTATAQSFRVQCPTSTITHPDNTTAQTLYSAEAPYTGPTSLAKCTANQVIPGTNTTCPATGFYVPTAGVNGAIKCQQISGGDGYSTMANGTQTFMFSFGPLSGLADIANGLPGTEYPSVFNTVYQGTFVPGDPATTDGIATGSTGGSLSSFTFNGAVGLMPDADCIADNAAAASAGTALPCPNLPAGGLDGHVDPRQIMDVGVMNGNIPAPLMAIDEDDEFFLTLTNVGMIMRPDLFEQHTVHFHGYPNASAYYDGVPDASVAINIGGSFTYYYLAPDAGTYFWHCHITPPEHLQMGMVGQIYVRPRQDRVPLGTSVYSALQAQQKDLRTACISSADILCTNPLPYKIVHGTDNSPKGGFDTSQPDPETKKYAYNDGDGMSAYDVEYPLQIHGFDPNFHFVGMTFNPEAFADMKDKFFLLNGRSYPDTVTSGPLTTESSDGRSHFSQPLNSIINIPAGGKALLRISDLSVTEYSTLASLGIPMHVVGYNAKLLRDQDGNNTDYYTNSITLAGGESLDVILDASALKSDGSPYKSGDVYYLFTPQLDHLSNDQENFGGLMTEVHIN
ncbi:MAG TPA: multicopper oxidase domain-containing protein [Terracidiphilus sp.]|jgi:FtsP/CotA-like multicopper oxidase with cupredoxin domain